APPSRCPHRGTASPDPGRESEMNILLDEQAPASAAGWLDRPRGGQPGPSRGWAALGSRRWLQLGLAALWLADALLQLQSVMFSKTFGETLAATPPGDPAHVADPH